MKYSIVALITALSLVSGPAMSKGDSTSELTQADEAQIDKMADTFFATLRAGKTEFGINQIFGSSSLMRSKTDQLAMLVSQIDSAINIYGKISSCEKVDTATKGAFVEYRTYTCQHANMLTSWNLAFFKTSNGWIAANLFFKDQPGQP